MTRLSLARILLSALFVASTAASFALDWQPNHLLNPAWPPHARFHGGLLLFTLAGMCAVALRAMWRRSAEPVAAVRFGGWLLLAYWTPLLYVNALVPGSSLWAGPLGAEPRWGGVVVYPNVVFAAVMVVVTAAAMSVARADIVASAESAAASARR